MPEFAPPRPRRAVPLDPVLVQGLSGRAQAIAKGWLLLLLERSPLEAAGAIPAAALAAEGPGLCSALVRALGSDAELDRLRGDGDLAPLAARAGALAGSIDAAATVAAVDALRACLWTAALEQRPERADAAAVAALAERLAEVCTVVAATALDATGLAPGIARDAFAASGAHTSAGPAAPERPAPLAFTPSLAEPAPVVPDEGDHDEGGHVPSAASVTALRAPAEPDADLRASAASAMDDGDLWISTLERHIDRCRHEGGGLALLRIELVDGERLVASATEDERDVPYDRLALAIRRAIRRQDLVASDHDGRAWVIAPGVGRAGGMALAERIGVGVERAEPWQGAPLAATVGFAVYGEDGRDAATLIDRAEEAMLAASAAGVRIGESIPYDGGGSEGDRPGPRLVR